MGGENDPAVSFAGHFQHHIVTFPGVFLLLQLDGSFLDTCFDDAHRILGVDIHAQQLVALADEAAQFPLIDVPVGVIHIAIVGDEAHSAVFQNVLIDPVAQVTVDHNDLAAAQGEAVVIGAAQVVQRCGDFAAAGAEIALAGNFLAVYAQAGSFHIRQIHFECFQLGFQTQIRAALLQILGAAQFFRSAAHTHIGGIFKNFHVIHS